MLLRFCSSCIILLAYLINEILASYEIWPDPVDDGREKYPKPTSWEDKNYGQWCRNRTIDRHIQCPMGSVLHLYICCGETNTECCFRLQPTVIAYTSALSAVFVASLVFYILLRLNLICPVENTRDSIEYRDLPKTG